MANALAQESSPYLRAHATNPVDWLPWGERALRRARREHRPLLVSIGYAACHWCHVMERESFEDPHVARLMNESFVCVKVDREERPDIDALYIDAVSQMTGSAGWPLNVFLTPEQLPFFGGTYFPPERTQGMPSWTDVLRAVAAAWRQHRGEIEDTATQMRRRLAAAAVLQTATSGPHQRTLTEAVSVLQRSFDPQHGGFGSAPKFPQPTVIELLLSEAAATRSRPAEEMALRTLRAIIAGGIHDQLGGGFHRYAVDASWTVPHFEKMLYDNALLARCCVRSALHFEDEQLLSAGVRALDWMLREMADGEGGFCCSLDADSEGREGAFHLWTLEELREVLGEDFEEAVAWIGATEQGNFIDPHLAQRGLNVLTARGKRLDPATEQRIRQLLLCRRERRVRPARDDKRLTAWNALAISALAEAGAHLQAGVLPFGDPQAAARMLQAAQRCAELTAREMKSRSGKLLHSWCNGSDGPGGYLDDYALLLEALIALYEATFDERHFNAAIELAEQMISCFADEEGGGFYSTAHDAERLVVRRKEVQDQPIPSGSSSAALGLMKLSALTGERRYEDLAIGAMRLVEGAAARHPAAFAHILQAMRLALGPMKQVAIIGPAGTQRDELVRVVRRALRPNVVLAVGDGQGTPSSLPLLKDRVALEGRPTAYVCEHFSCRQPVCDGEALSRLLDEAL